ncbi:hypothetical protein A3746_16260 [Oleibacter sp. HI0075]|nr:hypothetical protein A3746_16260 [Oleibacter sp. HI0075]|tara:strand:+ start:919 stop:1500 length:582 start_codon:yes stop_codon:yes gene_type:complete
MKHETIFKEISDTYPEHLRTLFTAVITENPELDIYHIGLTLDGDVQSCALTFSSEQNLEHPHLRWSIWGDTPHLEDPRYNALIRPIQEPLERLYDCLDEQENGGDITEYCDYLREIHEDCWELISKTVKEALDCDALRSYLDGASCIFSVSMIDDEDCLWIRSVRAIHGAETAQRFTAELAEAQRAAKEYYGF